MTFSLGGPIGSATALRVGYFKYIIIIWNDGNPLPDENADETLAAITATAAIPGSPLEALGSWCRSVHSF